MKYGLQERDKQKLTKISRYMKYGLQERDKQKLTKISRYMKYGLQERDKSMIYKKQSKVMEVSFHTLYANTKGN